MTKADERLDENGRTKLLGLLAAGDPGGEVINRVRRVGFGFTRFRNYRIRLLLYAGKPNRDLLATITPPLKSEEPSIPPAAACAPSKRTGPELSPAAIAPPRARVSG